MFDNWESQMLNLMESEDCEHCSTGTPATVPVDGVMMCETCAADAHNVIDMKCALAEREARARDC